MKRLLIIGGVIIVALFVIGYLYEQGYLDFEWQTLTMFFAALAGPYKLLRSKFEGSSVVDNILEKNEAVRINEVQHRKDFDVLIKEREDKIQVLNKEIELISTKYELLEEKKKKIQEDVGKMNVQDTQKEAMDLFGS